MRWMGHEMGLTHRRQMVDKKPTLYRVHDCMASVWTNSESAILGDPSELQ